MQTIFSYSFTVCRRYSRLLLIENKKKQTHKMCMYECVCVFMKSACGLLRDREKDVLVKRSCFSNFLYQSVFFCNYWAATSNNGWNVLLYNIFFCYYRHYKPKWTPFHWNYFLIVLLRAFFPRFKTN